MLSIRAKLSLWYLVMAASVIVAFSLGLYFYLSHALLRVIDDSLWSQANRMANSIPQGLSDPQGLSEEEIAQSNELRLPVQFYTVIDRAGEVYDYAYDVHGHPVPIIADALDRAHDQWQAQFDNGSISESEPVRIITWPVRDQDGVFFVVAGQSLKEIHQAQRRLLLLLAISSPLALILASLGGFWIADRALKPVDRITKAAERIGRGNFNERVEEPRTKDEIGRLAATFNEMIAKLDQAFQRERQFTAYASHELKTPLAIIRGDIEVALRRDRSTEEYRRVLSSSLEEIERLTRLTDDLLTLARSDAGEQVLEIAPVTLDQLAEEARAYLSPLAKSTGVRLSYESSQSPIVIEGDEKRLKQLLVNLLDNAIKYTPAGGDVRLKLAAQDSSAIIEVADTGRGIPADAMPHIFERFYRHSDPRDTRASGFGLGLAISKWIVDAHGGAIDVESSEGRGSRFTIRLPLRKDEG
jgi:heavy metal sensor kinase